MSFKDWNRFPLRRCADVTQVAESRKEALDRGLTFYLGTPCKHGHGQATGRNLRYTSVGGCVDCAKANSRQHWRQKRAKLSPYRAYKYAQAEARHVVDTLRRDADTGDAPEVWDEL